MKTQCSKNKDINIKKKRRSRPFLAAWVQECRWHSSQAVSVAMCWGVPYILYKHGTFKSSSQSFWCNFLPLCYRWEKLWPREMKWALRGWDNVVDGVKTHSGPWLFIWPRGVTEFLCSSVSSSTMQCWWLYSPHGVARTVLHVKHLMNCSHVALGGSCYYILVLS